MDIRGARLLITGATGFLGSAVVRHAVEAGAEVTALIRRGSASWRLEPVRGRYHTVAAAADDYRSLALDGDHRPDALVHCAASGVNQKFDDVGDMVAVNVGGTLAALQLATRVGARRFVLLGTSGEYGPGTGLSEGAPLRPTSEYGATRAAATLLALTYGARRGLPVTVLRPFSIFGPYEAAYRLVPHCVLRALAGEPLDISAGSQTRDFVFLADVVRAVVAAAAQGPDRTIVNVCTGVSTSVGSVAGLVAEIAGGTAPVQAGAVDHIPGEMWMTSGDPSTAAAVLQWAPRYGVREGLEETIDWFRSHRHLYARDE